MKVTMQEHFIVLSAPLNTRRLRAGQGGLHGDKTCVVRNCDTSRPCSAVRMTRGGSWACLSCWT